MPSKETKTYLGAGLAVLGVNLVSIQQYTTPVLQVQATCLLLRHTPIHTCAAACRGPHLAAAVIQVIASFVITAFREQPAPAVNKKDN